MARTRRQQLRDEQKQARAALKDLGVEILDSTEVTSNTLIVNMPDSLVDWVAALPGVKRVHRVRPVKMNLDHALPLHNVLRPDEVGPSLPLEKVLANAPETDGAFFKVPKILGAQEDSAG